MFFKHLNIYFYNYLSEINVWGFWYGMFFRAFELIAEFIISNINLEVHDKIKRKYKYLYMHKVHKVHNSGLILMFLSR